MRRLTWMLPCVCGALSLAAALAAEPTVHAKLEPREATIGDALELELSIELPEQGSIVAEPLGPELGPFRVLSGGWEPAPTDVRRQVWRGRVAAYRTGELELPPIGLAFERDGTTVIVRSEPLKVTISSVLPAPEEGRAEPALADLKPPASVPADWTALRIALGVLAGLLVLSLLGWWLARRLGPRLAARPVPSDPFHRMPPDVWAYGELRRLLERRLPEEGRIVEFHSDLSRILKRYLGGRYRVELMERTTAEVPFLLAQAGAPVDPSRDAEAMLQRCDRVKFARVLPDAAVCRAEIDEAYRIVDATRPLPAAEPAADRGAA